MDNTGYKQNKAEFVFLSGRLSLDFANTLIRDREETHDLLPDGAAVLNWALQAGLISPAQHDRWLEPLAANTLTALHQQAVQLRQVLAKILQGATEINQAGITQQLPALNRFLATGGLRRQIHPQGENFALDWQIETENPNGILTHIALDIAELIGEQNWRRIKKCQNSQCILHFFDSSKNGSRRWCSMALCGNREKVTRHRQKPPVAG